MSALTGIRVVELAGSVAGEYCGKLLADFGAEVIKIEAPGCGSPTRAMAPIVRRRGLRGQRAVRLPQHEQALRRARCRLRRPASRRLHGLIATADAVIDDRAAIGPPTGRSGIRTWCSARSPPSARTLPAEFGNAKSINVFHASGWGYHTPSHADPAKPPLQGPGRFLADYEAGLDAALCVAASLFGRLHSGQGEFIDISQHAVLVSRADCILGRFITGEVPAEGHRGDYDQQGPASFFACADGFVYLYMTSRAHWLGRQRADGSSGVAGRVRRRLAGVLGHRRKRSPHFSGGSPRGSGTWPKTPRRPGPAPGRAAGAGQRRCGPAPLAAVPPPRLLPARCGIRCWATRHIPPSRTRSARRRRESPLPHPLSASTPPQVLDRLEYPRPRADGQVGTTQATQGSARRPTGRGARRRAHQGVGRPLRGQAAGDAGRRGDQGRDRGQPRGDARLRRHRHQPRALLSEHQPRDPQRGPRYQVRRGHGAAARADRPQRHRHQQPAARARWSARAWGTSSSRRSSRTSSRCRSRCGATTGRWGIKPVMRRASPRWPGSRRWSATPVGLRSGRACATGIPRSARPPRTPPWWRCCIASSAAQGNSSTYRPWKPCPR